VNTVACGIGELEASRKDVQIIAEVETESIEAIVQETRKIVKETLDSVCKLQKAAIESSRKAERNVWIRMILSALIGFILGRTSTLIGF
jgi:ElaB/YqjD/DUF883 family membrane-anchored ribosome-binding protein